MQHTDLFLYAFFSQNNKNISEKIAKTNNVDKTVKHEQTCTIMMQILVISSRLIQELNANHFL